MAVILVAVAIRIDRVDEHLGVVAVAEVRPHLLRERLVCGQPDQRDMAGLPTDPVHGLPQYLGRDHPEPDIGEPEPDEHEALLDPQVRQKLADERGPVRLGVVRIGQDNAVRLLEVPVQVEDRARPLSEHRAGAPPVQQIAVLPGRVAALAHARAGGGPGSNQAGVVVGRHVPTEGQIEQRPLHRRERLAVRAFLVAEPLTQDVLKHAA